MNNRNHESTDTRAGQDVRKYFRTLVWVLITGVVLGILIFFISGKQQLLERSILIVAACSGLGIIAKETILTLREFYFKSFLVAIIFGAYSMLLSSLLGGFNDPLTYSAAISMLCLLTVQAPLRVVYLLIFKREPKVDRQGKFEDRIYSLALFLAMTFLPFFISDQLFPM